MIPQTNRFIVRSPRVATRGFQFVSILIATVASADDSWKNPDLPTTTLPPSGYRLASDEVAKRSERPILVFCAYIDENWDVYRWDFDPAHRPTRITNTPYDESAPALAPDHTFCVYETVDGRIWRKSLSDDSPPQQLPFASDQNLDMHPAVSPDGKRIALSTSLDRGSDDCDLAVFDIRANRFGRRLEMLAYQHYPNWGPDGKHLVFANLHGRLQTGRPIYEIWITRTDLPWARQLTMLDAMAISPAWSPQGDTVAFACNREGQFDIWLVDPATRSYRRVTNHESADTDPVFSPDGGWIMFESTRDHRTGLWRIKRAGGKALPVYPFGAESTTLCKDPDWK